VQPAARNDASSRHQAQHHWERLHYSWMHDPPEHHRSDRKCTNNRRRRPHPIAILGPAFQRHPLPSPHRTTTCTQSTSLCLLPLRSEIDMALRKPRRRKPGVRPENRKPSSRPHAESPLTHRTKNLHGFPPQSAATSIPTHVLLKIEPLGSCNFNEVPSQPVRYCIRTIVHRFWLPPWESSTPT
jgi:hypothetical protein